MLSHDETSFVDGMPSSVLRINCGSSSIRFGVFEAGDPPRRRLDGKVDRFGLSGTHLVVNNPAGSPPVSRRVAAADHRTAGRISLGLDRGAACRVGERRGTPRGARHNDLGVPPDVLTACCGDVPTLETLAAVSIMHEHLPELKIRVVHVVDLMKPQPQREHLHG
jgi:hypothetical protein